MLGGVGLDPVLTRVGDSGCSAAIWMRPATVRMGIWHRGNGMIVAA